MIKFFNRDKEQIKRVLVMVYKIKDVEKTNDNELAFCYIAKTLDSLENFCELAESAYLELDSRILKIEKALKNASDFSEFKSFCLEDYNETTRHIPKDSVTVEDKTPKEEPTMDGLAEFNFETYKEEVEAAVNKARTTIDKFDEFDSNEYKIEIWTHSFCIVEKYKTYSL